MRWSLGLRLSPVTLLLLVAAAGCSGLLRGYAEGRSSTLQALRARHGKVGGQAQFLFGDLGGLNTDAIETNALPWKLVAAALVLAPADGHGGPPPPPTQAMDRRALDTRLARFGLLVPEAVENWREPYPLPAFDQAAGIVTGAVQRRLPPIRFEVANLGCAACHAGVTYGPDGLPTRNLWLGLPNTSFDPGAYTHGVYRALQAAVGDPETLLDAVRRLFPEVDSRELRTLRRHVLPRVADRLAELRAGLDAPTTFDNGAPGLTNGVAALKRQLGLLSEREPADEHGYTAIPELGGRLLRSSLLYDGAYGVPGRPRFRPMEAGDPPSGQADALARIVTFFTVPTMGVRPGALDRPNSGAAAILDFLGEYRPPPFPGPIDRGLATAGLAVYRAHCAACHGEHANPADSEPPLALVSFPNRLSPQEEIGTDPHRWQAMDGALVQAIRGSAYGDQLDPANTGGYVATPLTGLWATAPYLHNGSVPSLWHLMHPAERPARFLAGGHALDFDTLGIRYPEGYVPWSAPRLYDTTLPGRGNRGHERPFETLDEGEKQALLEYLKLL